MIIGKLKKFKYLIFVKRWVRSVLELPRNYAADLMLYWKYSASLADDNSLEKLEGRICVFYHALEKGMALPDPRLGFGQDKAIKLAHYCEIYSKLSNTDPELIASVYSTIKEYMNLNGNYLGSECLLACQSLLGLVESEQGNWMNKKKGGTRSISRPLLAFDQYSEFCRSRSSVRVFNHIPVSRSAIIECIELACCTPSVCNRQPWKVYIYDNEKDVKRVLSFQHGNQGFGHTVPAVLLITCDRSKFWHSHERNQLYVDGGMFSMSLIHAIHAKGFGACCLNLSITSDHEKLLKKNLSIPAREAPIMMVAVGNYNDTATVAFSNRKSIKAFLG